MPELPEVETVARRLDPLLGGRVLRRIEVRDPLLVVDARRRAVGRPVRGVARRGKEVAIVLGGRRGGPDAIELRCHLRMTGRLIWLADGETRATPRHVRATLRFDGGRVVFDDPRRFGTMAVVPRETFIDIVSPRLRNPDGDDLVALRVEVEGERDGSDRTVTYDLLDYYDAKNRITAMMRTTGYSLAITSVMQADGRVEQKGVHTPDEAMPAEPYIAELAKHGIDIRKSVS